MSRMNMHRAVAFGVLGIGMMASLVAMGAGNTASPRITASVLRPLSAAELSRYSGADSGDGGGGSTKDCFASPANCSNIIPCPKTGAYPCTTCTANPGGSSICRNAQTSGCQQTGIFNCPDALAGTCFSGTCVATTAQQCGTYYTCQ